MKLDNKIEWTLHRKANNHFSIVWVLHTGYFCNDPWGHGQGTFTTLYRNTTKCYVCSKDIPEHILLQGKLLNGY